MNIHLLKALVHFIEGVFQHSAPQIVAAAESGAIESAEQDPKVKAVTEASIVLLAAAKQLKTAINEHPDVATPGQPN